MFCVESDVLAEVNSVSLPLVSPENYLGRFPKQTKLCYRTYLTAYLDWLRERRVFPSWEVMLQDYERREGRDRAVL